MRHEMSWILASALLLPAPALAADAGRAAGASAPAERR